jgi:hypothetical protein
MMRTNLLCLFLTLIVLASTAANAAPASPRMDLQQAITIAQDDSIIVHTAQRMLREEIAKRTGITLESAAAMPGSATPVILLCLAETPPSAMRDFITTMNVPEKAEGFAIAVHTEGAAPVVVLAGRDEAGVLFAAGRLLLKLRLSKGLIELPADYRVATAPRYPHRGHQIGFRNLAHCYDAWTPETYEQYMRELAVFGANAFETTRFGSPDEYDGPHAKVTKGEMAAAWSRICADYGFEFWLFASAVGGEGSTAEEIEETIQSRLVPLRAIPHLDHLYMTGGDGSSEFRRPDLMFEWTARLAEAAREIHPDLGIWVSNQGFCPELNNWFFDYLQKEEPDWVTGVVYGAWSRVLLDEQRARIPEKYPLRRYNDIGHCVRSQYPVAGWDRAFARTLGREPFAPRPRWQARMHNLVDQHADGFVTYSDGVGDDVNKFVWTALGWNPDAALDDILFDYSRFFFGSDIAEQVREGLYLFEKAFEGSLAENEDVLKNFRLWKSLEEQASPALLGNWRFQECLLRAYYDHYTRLRLLKANDIEERACATLRTAPEIGVERAIATARDILQESDQDETTHALRKRLIELGAELFESIGAQLDVATYQARSTERGAVLAFLDIPLNNRLWLEHEMAAILAGTFTASMPEHPGDGDLRLTRLARVVDWESAGPGGFYDDLGCSWKQPHLVKPKPLWDDPAGVTTPREGHTFDNGDANRLSWLDVSEGLFGAPIVLRYDSLDPSARYRVRVTYLGRYKATMRLVADDKYEIHSAFGHTMQGVRYTVERDSAAVVEPPEVDGRSGRGRDGFDGEAPKVAKPEVTPLEFVIPPAATQDGELKLEWELLTGRGAQVAEVWLIKE